MTAEYLTALAMLAKMDLQTNYLSRDFYSYPNKPNSSLHSSGLYFHNDPNIIGNPMLPREATSPSVCTVRLVQSSHSSDFYAIE